MFVRLFDLVKFFVNFPHSMVEVRATLSLERSGRHVVIMVEIDFSSTKLTAGIRTKALRSFRPIIIVCLINVVSSSFGPIIFVVVLDF